MVSGPCGACHIPHNAVDKRLWARTLSVDNGAAPQYCTGCHAENGAAKEKQVGKHDHPVDVVLKGRDIPPPGRVLEMLPLYNAEGGTQGGDRIMCRTCHDPHIWSADGKGTDPTDVSANTTDTSVKNVEGDARNSFLRRVASPTPDLCVVCHEDTALLAGTDHDFFITAPSAKNQLGRTVIETGQCGVCHAIHNGAQERLLWAQAYGPVEENQHPMNALCTGCHSKGNMAEDKIPPVASHPKGKLIDNIFTFNQTVQQAISSCLTTISRRSMSATCHALPVIPSTDGITATGNRAPAGRSRGMPKPVFCGPRAIKRSVSIATVKPRSGGTCTSIRWKSGKCSRA